MSVADSCDLDGNGSRVERRGRIDLQLLGLYAALPLAMPAVPPIAYRDDKNRHRLRGQNGGGFFSRIMSRTDR